MKLRLVATVFLTAFSLAGSASGGPVIYADIIDPSGTIVVKDVTPTYPVVPNLPADLDVDDNGGAFWATANLVQEFLTFCLEYEESVNASQTYNYTTSSVAIGGGGGPNPDPVSNLTKWLYYQAITGDYATLTELALVADRGKVIQQAIWLIEDEGPLLPFVVDPAAALLVARAFTEVVVNGWTPASVGLHIVAVNLKGPIATNPLKNAQSVLGLVAVPEAGSLGAMLLGMAAVSGYAVRRRRTV